MAMTIEQQLADAQASYHALMTGTMARVVVDQNGERVEFTATNKAQLAAYIQQLMSQIPTAGTIPFGTPSPIQFTF